MSPGFTSAVELAMLATAEESATERISRWAMTPGASGSLPTAWVTASALRFTTSFMPSARPVDRPPTRYTAPAATYFTLKEVCTLSLGGISAAAAAPAGVAPGFGRMAAVVCASAGAEPCSCAAGADGHSGTADLGISGRAAAGPGKLAATVSGWPSEAAGALDCGCGDGSGGVASCSGYS